MSTETHATWDKTIPPLGGLTAGLSLMSLVSLNPFGEAAITVVKMLVVVLVLYTIISSRERIAELSVKVRTWAAIWLLAYIVALFLYPLAAFALGVITAFVVTIVFLRRYSREQQ